MSTSGYPCPSLQWKQGETRRPLALCLGGAHVPKTNIWRFILKTLLLLAVSNLVPCDCLENSKNKTKFPVLQVMLIGSC